MPTSPQEFKVHATRAKILEKYSSEEIVLSTANTYSYTRGGLLVKHLLLQMWWPNYIFIVKKSVKEYIEKYMIPQSASTRASG